MKIVIAVVLAFGFAMPMFARDVTPTEIDLDKWEKELLMDLEFDKANLELAEAKLEEAKVSNGVRMRSIEAEEKVAVLRVHFRIDSWKASLAEAKEKERPTSEIAYLEGKLEVAEAWLELTKARFALKKAELKHKFTELKSSHMSDIHSAIERVEHTEKQLEKCRKQKAKRDKKD